MGNDEVMGDAGDDLIVGDFVAFALHVALETPTTLEEQVELEQDIKELADNVARHLEARHHNNHYEVLHASYAHSHFGERGGSEQEQMIQAGSDVIAGGPDNDFILADSDSAAATYLYDQDQRFDEPDPEFKVNFLIRENYELIDHYDRVMAVISQDVVNGNGGDDYLYGQYNDDTLFGGDGDDIVFGGSGQTSPQAVLAPTTFVPAAMTDQRKRC